MHFILFDMHFTPLFKQCGLKLSDVPWYMDSGDTLIYCNIAASSLTDIICMTTESAAQCLMESADISVKP